MRDIDNCERTDLGDAVVETKGSAMVGIVEPLGGFRAPAGISSED